MDQLLTLLSADARLTNAQLAAALSISEEEVAARIADYEERRSLRATRPSWTGTVPIGKASPRSSSQSDPPAGRGL